MEGADHPPGTGTGARRLARGPRLPTLLLLGVVAAALIGAVALMWQTISAERVQRAEAARTNAAIIALRDILRTAVNAETGQRGYFITLDPRYLAPYVTARQQYRPAVERLRALVGPDAPARQRQLVDAVGMYNEAKFAEMAQTVGEIEGGNLIEARRTVLTDEGQDLMERLRQAVYELERLELEAYQHNLANAEALEGRIVPTLAGLLVLILLTLGLGLMQVIRTADAEARAAGAAELALARDRADLLAHELNHRVKNLFAVVLAIVRMSGRDQPDARDVVNRIADRIRALLNAHEVTQGASARRSARLDELVETALQPYRSDDNHTLLDGGPVELPERAVVPLGLVLHELTTNAVKYGAWSQPGGLVEVRWRARGGRLRLDWAEQLALPLDDVPDEPGRRGFGSSLIEGSLRQLGGQVERRFTRNGVVVALELTLVLEGAADVDGAGAGTGTGGGTGGTA